MAGLMTRKVLLSTGSYNTIRSTPSNDQVGWSGGGVALA